MSEFPGDVRRLVEVAAKRGFILDPLRAEAIWDAHSDAYAAGWLMMDGETDDDLWYVISNYAGRV